MNVLAIAAGGQGRAELLSVQHSTERYACMHVSITTTMTKTCNNLHLYLCLARTVTMWIYRKESNFVTTTTLPMHK